MVKTAIVSEPIFPEEILSGFSSPIDGACLLFLGVVRDHNKGRGVSGLDYEVYQGMAERTLAAIVHVGEVSTAIAVATPHRGEAYEASRYILEELKQRLPIWKREHYLDGESHWVGGNRVSGGGDGRQGPSRDEERGG